MFTDSKHLQLQLAYSNHTVVIFVIEGKWSCDLYSKELHMSSRSLEGKPGLGVTIPDLFVCLFF